MNSPAPAWIEQASSLIKAGVSPEVISRQIGVGVSRIRRHFNVNGYADRAQQRRDDYKRRRLTGELRVKAAPVSAPEPEPVAKISLPFVGILSGHVSPIYQMVAL